jgi:hypothetical protein
MKFIYTSFIVVLISLTFMNVAQAQEANWVIFDPAYPLDFIDVNSITSPTKGIIRFWERGGLHSSINKNGDTVFAMYSLTEINVKLKQIRTLKCEMALEDQATLQGIEAKAKFIQGSSEILKNYPTQWESLEPDKHSYARYNFVCKRFKK